MSLPDELERYFQQRAQQDTFSGVVLLTQGSTQLFAGAYGYASRSWKRPNTNLPSGVQRLLLPASTMLHHV